MEQFVVSARKYRPITFDSVVGQKSITETLKNAMKNHHMAQAFLFCGPRGVGKTTCARILARTINCENPDENVEPCNQCDSCTSFNNGQSLNIHELDAASNNSVDDIRNLIDQVRFAPQMGSYKVYIIDEVHMLSQAAFNAFLKTLEEPPKHAIFILATTEKHKIIPTILSRCQIFDFKRIQIDDIANHLSYISEKEGVKAEADGLHIIAQKADGALRDALSIFDQIVSFSGNEVSYQNVIDNLNILDYDYYFKVTDGILNANIPDSLLIFNDILDRGFNGHNFIVGLAEHFRNLLVCKDASTLQLLEAGEKTKARYIEQAGLCNEQLLLAALNVCNKCDINYKMSKNQRLQIELTLMQLCSIKSSLEKKSPDVTEIDIQLDFSGGRQASPAKAKIAVQEVSQPKKILQPSPPEFITKEPQKKYTNHQAISVKLPNTGSFLGGISLKEDIGEYKTQKQQVNEEIDLSNKPKTPFNIENLLTEWKNYAESVRKSGKESFYTTMVRHEPVLLKDFVIKVQIENRVQKEDINIESADLLAYLREKLNNYSIKINPVIIKASQENVTYTSRDKFKRMAEKNPDILKLKERFDLDIEY